MDVSLNEIVTIISERSGRQFDASLKEELKKVVNIKRAFYFKKVVEKNPTQRKFFFKDISVPVSLVSSIDSCITTDLSCDVLQSSVDVPRPIRGSYALFDFVGSLDKTTPFGYATPDQLEIYKYNKYTSKSPKYFYINNKIVIFNAPKVIKHINVRGVFADPRELITFSCTNSGGKCYTDDDSYFVDDATLDLIITDTMNMFRIPLMEQEEVEIDNTK